LVGSPLVLVLPLHWYALYLCVELVFNMIIWFAAQIFFFIHNQLWRWLSEFCKIYFDGDSLDFYNATWWVLYLIQ
jgi:hypothetical protein